MSLPQIQLGNWHLTQEYVPGRGNCSHFPFGVACLGTGVPTLWILQLATMILTMISRHPLQQLDRSTIGQLGDVRVDGDLHCVNITIHRYVTLVTTIIFLPADNLWRPCIHTHSMLNLSRIVCIFGSIDNSISSLPSAWCWDIKSFDLSSFLPSLPSYQSLFFFCIHSLTSVIWFFFLFAGRLSISFIISPARRRYEGIYLTHQYVLSSCWALFRLWLPLF